MPANESIIAVPITVESPGQTRQFLVRLVEQLDVVLGNRGGDPYVSLSQLQSTTSSELSKLEQTVLEIIESLIAEDSVITNELLTSISDQTNVAIEALKSPDVISDSDTTTQTISVAYVQAESQAMAAQIAANAVDFNDLLIALRDTGIIAT